MGKKPDKYTGTSLRCVCTQRFLSSLRDERKSRESRSGDETKLTCCSVRTVPAHYEYTFPTNFVVKHVKLTVDIYK